MYQFSINKIRTIYGDELELHPLTVFVGPNNSGKSRILKDILNLTTDSKKHTVVLDDIEYNWPSSYDELAQAYKIEVSIDANGNHYLKSLNPSLQGNSNLNVGAIGWEENVNKWIQTKNSKSNFSSYFGRFLVNFLNTEDRLKIIKEADSGNVNVSVDNLLQATYKEGKEIEDNLRQVIKENFTTDIKLDYSQLTRLAFRIGEDLSKIPEHPREARPIFEKLQKIDDQGDGIKSFIATYLSLIVGSKPLLLIDEPEAFLHPPQSIKLGEIVAKQSNKNQQIIIATHSTDFLRGLLNVRQDISIIRIDRNSKGNIITPINAKEIYNLFLDPLLSSSRILDGLFYKGTVITESDSDATFYQRISRQIRTNDDVHYTHAHNKQTTHKAASPYKKLNIKHAIIVDFDILREKEEFRKIFEQSNFKPEESERLLYIQEAIKKEIESTPVDKSLDKLISDIDEIKTDINKRRGKEDVQKLLLETRKRVEAASEKSKSWSEYKKNGARLLSKSGGELFEELSLICSTKGIFIVPVGELESWLSDYGVPYTQNKSKWITNALEAIPKLKADNKVDPWHFVESIHKYLES